MDLLGLLWLNPDLVTGPSCPYRHLKGSQPPGVQPGSHLTPGSQIPDQIPWLKFHFQRFSCIPSVSDRFQPAIHPFGDRIIQILHPFEVCRRIFTLPWRYRGQSRFAPLTAKHNLVGTQPRLIDRVMITIQHPGQGFNSRHTRMEHGNLAQISFQGFASYFSTTICLRPIGLAITGSDT